MRRRHFIVAATTSLAAALGLAYIALPGDEVDDNAVDLRCLSARDQVVLAALLPVILAGYVAPQSPFPNPLERQLVATIDNAIAVQLPRVQDELRQLFDVLEINLVRVVFTHQVANWNELNWSTKHALLLDWRDSALALLQTAYSGLHDLILAAYFIEDAHWPAIGYQPPPALRG